MADKNKLEIRLEVDDTEKTKIKGVGDSLDTAATKAKSSWSKLGTYLKDHFVITLGDITRIVGRMIGTIKDWVAAASFQEAQEIKLAQALKTTGQYTEATQKELTKYAAELQKTTTYGDEAIIGVEALLTQYKLTPDVVKKATKATLDLAAATGTDLKAAAQVMGRAAAGETSMLKRYGIMIDENTLKTKGFEAVLEGVNSQFGGQAQAQANTWAGLMTQINNIYGDLKEVVAGLITKNEGLRERLKAFKDYIGSNEFANAVVGVFKALGFAIDKVITSFQLLGTFIAGTINNMINLGAIIKDVVTLNFSGLDTSVAAFKTGAIDAGTQIVKLGSDLFGFGQSLEGVTKKQTEAAEATQKHNNELIRQQEEANKTSKALDEAFNLLGIKSDEALQKEIEAIEKAYEAVEQAYENGKATEEDLARSHEVMKTKIAEITGQTKTDLSDLGLVADEVAPKVAAIGTVGAENMDSLTQSTIQAGEAMRGFTKDTEDAVKAMSRLEQNKSKHSTPLFPSKGSTGPMSISPEDYNAMVISMDPSAAVTGIGLIKPYQYNSIDGYSKA